MLHQTVFNTSEICRAFGVTHAVLSPGSRNAPLTISFARNEGIQKHIIPDERSAGFIALGIAQKLKKPVVLCCTSGTALLNYAPAIAEAFYREIPLIVLSADRPPELIDQRDGQTIRQFEALKNHVKLSAQLPTIEDELSSENYQKTVENALEQSMQLPMGPVHLNIPFREPFYPTADQNLSLDYKPAKGVQDLKSEETSNSLPIDLTAKKVLILVGQQGKDLRLSESLEELNSVIPVIQSPLNNLEVQGIGHVDLFLNCQKELIPDVLITSGLSVLSKKLKVFLRAHKPGVHYHFDPADIPVNTYDSSPELIQESLASFLSKKSFDQVDKEYVKLWKAGSDKIRTALGNTISELPFSECKAFHQLSTSLPTYTSLHLSNSMPVRFADLFGLDSSIESWCNRGTSGIDGCTSTAIGTSLVSENLNVLLTGDLSFLYDRNAFFHNYKAKNLRIVVFNNQGGGIFRLIDGPKKLPELEEYFETRHDRTAEYICLENKIEYYQARSEDGIEDTLKSFYDPSDKTKLLEIFTVPEINEQAFKQLKQQINEQVNF